MMAVLPDRRFGTFRTFLTCHGSRAGGSPDVRVVRWRLAADYGSAEFVSNVVTGLPATSGRHGGCRLRFGSEGALYIGPVTLPTRTRSATDLWRRQGPAGTTGLRCRLAHEPWIGRRTR
jgi:glucose/arabinose dehydrogenase